MKNETIEDYSFKATEKMTCTIDESSFTIKGTDWFKPGDKLQLSFTKKSHMCFQISRPKSRKKKYVWGKITGFRIITIGEYYELITFTVEKYKNKKHKWNVDIINQIKRPPGDSSNIRLRQIFTFNHLPHSINHSSGTGGGYAA